MLVSGFTRTESDNPWRVVFETGLKHEMDLNRQRGKREQSVFHEKKKKEWNEQRQRQKSGNLLVLLSCR